LSLPLLPEAELVDHRAVAVLVDLPEVIEETTTTTDDGSF